MKTVILHNVNMYQLSKDDKRYLTEGRVTYAMTDSKSSLNTIFLMWDDRKYDEERNTWDEKLSPSPIHRVCDFIRDIWTGPESEVEHLCNVVQQMRMDETLHYDVEGYTFDVRNLDKYDK